MKVLLINGSPKEKGCTFTALSEVASTLNEQSIETEIFHVGNKAIQGCIGCGACRGKGKCVFGEQDGVNAAIEKSQDVDAIIIGTPVHYAAASGAITSFMDRFFYANSRKMAGKLGAAVISARRGGTTATFDQINKYFTISNMPVVSSSYWNMVHGNTPDEVKQDLEGMQTMRTLGQNMAWLLKCMEAGRNAGIEYPKLEDKIFTNFIR